MILAKEAIEKAADWWAAEHNAKSGGHVQKSIGKTHGRIRRKWDV